MSDNVLVTPGSGASIRAKNIAGQLTQIVQLDLGGESAELQLIADPTYGVPVDIKRFPAGAVLVNNPTAANLKVDASGATVPISAASSIPVSALNTAPVFVRLSNGTIAIDTIPVSGGLTAAQGAPAAASSGWPVKITDGTNIAAVDSGSGGLKVAVVAGGGGGTSIADRGTFTEGTTLVTPVGGEYNSSPSAPSTGQAAAVLITQARALQINLRNNAGTEIGTSSVPVRVDPVGTTTQPVSLNNTPSTVLYVTRGGRANPRVTKSIALVASTTGGVLWTPASGKTFYVTKIMLALSVGGTLTIFDQTFSAANALTGGTMPIGFFFMDFDEPWASAAVNNVLQYTSGTGLTGTVTLHGFEV